MGDPYRIHRVRISRGIDVKAAMTQARQGAHAGYVDMRPLEPDSFAPTIPLPEGDYWLEDIDLGHDLLNVAPQEAERLILAAGRLPLTLEEGVAVLRANPGILREANCFQMLASSAGDRRVPSLWVTKEGRPRLGWCWRGTPHTWLGAASCATRTPASEAG